MDSSRLAIIRIFQIHFWNIQEIFQKYLSIIFFIKLILAVWRGSEYFRNISDFFLNQIDSSRLAIILIFQKHFWNIQEISKHYFLIRLILAGLARIIIFKKFLKYFENFWNIFWIKLILAGWQELEYFRNMPKIFQKLLRFFSELNWF